MSFIPGISRGLFSCLALLSLLSGCQSTPGGDVFISSRSSLLAVDVLFPFPMSRDPSLVQVFFVKGPIQEGLFELPELIPATFVKRSRAYLLDPEPGTYSLVAVTSTQAPPLKHFAVEGGVTLTVWNDEIGDAVIFPAELIQRTRTTIRFGDVAFMGALRIQRGERINADTVLEDDLQKGIAERLQPGVTSESGLAGRFSTIWMLDNEETVLTNHVADRESFLDSARSDLGVSPWAGVIARVAPSRTAPVARATTSAPRPKPAVVEPEEAVPAPGPEHTAKDAVSITASAPEVAPVPPLVVVPEPETPDLEAASPQPPPVSSEEEVAAAKPPVVVPERAAAAEKVQVVVPNAETLASKPEVVVPDLAPPEPAPVLFRGIPVDSPLAKIEYGMHHGDVHKILGDPDGRESRITSKAWIPFYNGPGARQTDWIYDGMGRVVFSLHSGTLEVFDVVYDPDTTK